MPTPSLGLHIFLAINRFLTIDNLFKYIFLYIYAPPPRGLSTLAGEFTAATSIMQSSPNELNTPVSDKV